MKNIKPYTQHVQESADEADEPTKKLLHLLRHSNSLNDRQVIDEAKRLISEGADLEAKENVNGRNALHLAVWRGSNEIALAAIEAGVDLEAKDEEGHTPLVAATLRNMPRIVDALVDAGADVDAICFPGRRTLLHIAPSAAMARLFIRKGIPVDTRDHGGDTPLLSAARSTNVKLVKEFIDAGADPNAMNWREMSALGVVMHRVANLRANSISISKDVIEVARMLILAGTDLSMALDDLDELKKLFGGDISWIPEDQPGMEKLRKTIRSRGAFGRF